MTRKRISVLAGAAVIAAARPPLCAWYRSMMSAAGYQWMTGGAGAPGWMRGALPGAMMGTSTDPGKIMGSLWANAPGRGSAPPGHHARQPGPDRLAAWIRRRSR